VAQNLNQPRSQNVKGAKKVVQLEVRRRTRRSCQCPSLLVGFNIWDSDWEQDIKACPARPPLPGEQLAGGDASTAGQETHTHTPWRDPGSNSEAVRGRAAHRAKKMSRHAMTMPPEGYIVGFLFVLLLLWVFTRKKVQDVEEVLEGDLKATQRARIAHMLETTRSYNATLSDIQKLNSCWDSSLVKNNQTKEQIRTEIASVVKRESELATTSFLERLAVLSTQDKQGIDTWKLKRKIDLVSTSNVESFLKEEITDLVPFFLIDENLAVKKPESRVSNPGQNKGSLKRSRESDDPAEVSDTKKRH
jgi:hypothetical protein